MSRGLKDRQYRRLGQSVTGGKILRYAFLLPATYRPCEKAKRQTIHPLATMQSPQFKELEIVG
jgi:hypothetical protein